MITVLVIYVPLLLLAFYLLYFFSENYFVPSLDKLSERFNLSSDISGATFMAAGSSAPELAVVIASLLVAGNHEAIGIGTIIGSALFNLFVIVGAVMVLRNNTKMVWQPLVRDLIFYALSIILLFWFFKDGIFSMHEAIIFVGGYVVYFGSLFMWKKIFPYKDTEEFEVSTTETNHNRFNTILFLLFPKVNNLYFAFVLDVVVIGLLSWLLVHSAIEVSAALGIPEVIIALTVIALGTSVPDLIASVVVAKQGRPGMAINNAIASNIFDILIGLGFPFLLLFIFSSKSIAVDNGNLWVSFFLLMGSIVILTMGFLIAKWKTNRWIGWLLILLYSLYLLYQIACVLGSELCN
jgi:K+-dependent Na+/Ca+ exchanger-like protein